MDRSASNDPPRKKRLISYKGWFMILLMAFLVILRPVPGQSIDYLAGRFVGSVLVIAAIWVSVILIFRWVSRHFRKAT